MATQKQLEREREQRGGMEEDKLCVVCLDVSANCPLSQLRSHQVLHGVCGLHDSIIVACAESRSTTSVSKCTNNNVHA